MHWTKKFFEGKYQAEYFEYVANEERTASEVEFVLKQLELTADSCVLDLACGSGRHSLALAPQVSHVTGMDLTEMFLDAAKADAAKQGASNVEFCCGDMRELDFDCKFDAALNYFTAWGYYSDAENFDVLRRVNNALKPGGVFLLETLNRDALMRSFRPQGYSISDDGTVRLDSRWFNLSAGRSHNKRIYLRPDGSRDELEFDHYMPTADALVRHFQDAGFQEVRAVEAPSGNELTMDSWRMAVVGVK